MGSPGLAARAARLGACAALALATLAAPAPARANGRFPASNMLVGKPGDPSHLALRATYGLLFSSDGGASWDWVCEKAVGYGGAEDPSIVLTGSGAIVVGLFRGMARSTDGGCTWEHDAAWPQSVVDLALRRAAPDRVYAGTCVFSRVADAGSSLFKNAVEVSPDAGKTWATRATLDPTILVDSIEVAESDPGRVYLSAIRPRGRETTGLLLVSDDDGAHFQERPVPFGPDDRGIYIAAVDPHEASRIYLRTTGVDAGRLLVSDDAGKTIRELFHGGPLPGFALADDGAEVFVGGPKDGLLRAAGGDLEKQNPLPIQCLASIGPTLWACAPTGVGYVLGASSDDGRSFAPKLTLAGTRGPVACAGQPRVAEVCAADWAAFRALVDPKLGTAGDGSAASSAPAPAPQPRAASSCRCALPGAPNAPAPLALVFTLFALVLHRGRAALLRHHRRARRGHRSRLRAREPRA